MFSKTYFIKQKNVFKENQKHIFKDRRIELIFTTISETRIR
jgi:hypothetical protein